MKRGNQEENGVEYLICADDQLSLSVDQVD